MIEEVKVEKMAFGRYRLLVREVKYNSHIGNHYPITALVMSHEEVLQIVTALQHSLQRIGGDAPPESENGLHN